MDAPRRTAFGRALVDFKRQIEEEEKDQNTQFYREVITQTGQFFGGDGPAPSVQDVSEDFQGFVVGLDTNDRKNSKMRKVSDKLKPLVDGLMGYAGVADVIMQAGGDIALLVYGGAKLVLTLAQKYTEGYERVVETLAEVGACLKTYNLLAEAYESSFEMQELLFETYKNILNFWRDASRLFEKTSFKTLWKVISGSFEATWKRYQTRLERDALCVARLGQAAEAMAQKKRDRALQVERVQKEKDDILDWVLGRHSDGIFDVETELEAKTAAQCDGTCGWIVKDPKILDWLDMTENGAIWLTARPGSGKSIASAKLVRTLREQGRKVVYFFCSFKYPSTSSVIRVLHSLIAQTLQYYDEVPEEIRQIHRLEKQRGVRTLQTVGATILTFKAAIKSISRLHIIVDGLDELRAPNTDLRELINCFDLFQGLQQTNTNGLVKWFFSSRSYAEPRFLPNGLANTNFIELKSETTANDIRSYLASCPTTNTWSEEDRESWVEGADGNFLWIILMVKILSTRVSEYDKQRALNEFPKGLKNCYMATLMRLLDRPEPEQDLARRLFTLIVHSCQPLSLPELQNALAVHLDAEDHSEDRVVSTETLERLCWPLFETVSRKRDGVTVILPSHKTVRDFFVQDPSKMGIEKSLYPFFQCSKDGDTTLGQVCLQYLKYSRYANPMALEETRRVIEEDPSHAFLKYAAVFYHSHLTDGSKSAKIFERFKEFVYSPNFWTCVQVQTLLTPYLFRTFETSDGESYNAADPTCGANDPSTITLSAAPIPLWLDDYGEEGKSIVESYMTWISEWGHVLRDQPGSVYDCSPIIRGSDKTLGQNHQGRMRITCLDKVEALKGKALVCLGRNTRLDKQIKWRKLKGSASEADSDLPSLRGSTLSNVLEENGSFNLVLQSAGGLAVSMCNSEDSTFQVGLFAPPGKAEQVGTELSNGFEERFSEALQHIVKSVTKRSQTVFAAYSSIERSIACQDSKSRPDDDSGDESDDSDYSDDEIPTHVPEDKAGTVHHICAVLGDEKPFSHLWSRCEKPAIATNCVVHYKKRTAIWMLGPGQIAAANLDTRQLLVKTIQTQVDAEGQATRYELCIDEKRATVNIVTIESSNAIDTDSRTTRFKITLLVASIDDILEPEKKDIFTSVGITIWHTVPHFPEECHLQRVLVSQTADHCYIILPQLDYSPKVLRVPLSAGNSSAETLDDKIFFPSSVSCRSPRLFVHEIEAQEAQGAGPIASTTAAAVASAPDTLFYVLLTGRKGPDHHHQQQQQQTGDGGGGEGGLGSSSCSGPALMQWLSSSFGGWRAWDDKRDGRSASFAGSTVFSADEIKGSYVDPDQKFSVPVRGGLNFSRKHFLSCW